MFVSKSKMLEEESRERFCPAERMENGQGAGAELKSCGLFHFTLVLTHTKATILYHIYYYFVALRLF